MSSSDRRASGLRLERPKFGRGRGWDNLSSQSENDDVGSDNGTDTPEVIVGLAEHVLINGASFNTRHGHYFTDMGRRVLVNSAGKPMHASEANKYTDNIPQLYRSPSVSASNPADDPSSFLVSFLTTEQLFEFLGQWKSLVPAAVFEEKTVKLRQKFAAYFDQNANDHQQTETLLTERFVFYLNGAATLVTAGEDYEFRTYAERTSLATGTMCKLLQGGSADSEVMIDEDAGIMGFCDLLVEFGDGDESLAGDVFCVFEFKTKGRHTSQYWYRNGGAMCSQLYQSLIGHNAKMGMAVMPGGFKIVVKHDLPNNRARFSWWPKGDSLCEYSSRHNRELLRLILNELSRVGIFRVPPLQDDGENNENVNDTPSLSAGNHGSPTSNEKKRSKSPPPTVRKTQPTSESDSPASKKKKNKRGVSGVQKDAWFIAVANDGSDGPRFSALEVSSRFTQEEIAREYHRHRVSEQKGTIPKTRDDDDEND